MSTPNVWSRGCDVASTCVDLCSQPLPGWSVLGKEAGHSFGGFDRMPCAHTQPDTQALHRQASSGMLDLNGTNARLLLMIRSGLVPHLISPIAAIEPDTCAHPKLGTPSHAMSQSTL